MRVLAIRVEDLPQPGFRHRLKFPQAGGNFRVEHFLLLQPGKHNHTGDNCQAR